MQYNTEISSGITLKPKHRTILLFGRGYTEHAVLVFFCICSIILLFLCVITAGARFLRCLDGKTLKTQFVIQSNIISISHLNWKNAALITH